MRATVPAVSLLACLAYATLRYQVFKGVPWPAWPLYTVNKAFALGGLVLVCAALLQWRRGRPASLAGWAAAFMAIHIVLSLIILDPLTYPKYFADGRLTLAASWSWLVGACAAPLLWRAGRSCTPADGSAVPLLLGSAGLLTGLHAAVLGYGGWFAPSGWPGYMLPITLVSALIGLACAGLALGARRDTRP